MRLIAALAVPLSLCLLAGCATNIDRHGRPIDGWKPLTRDTTPDPGPQPTDIQAREVISVALPKNQRLLAITGMAESATIGNWGKVYSGWLVCYYVQVHGDTGFPRQDRAFVFTQPDGVMRAAVGVRTNGPGCVS